MRRAVVAVAAATVVVALLPWVMWWSSLPDPVATHWDLYGDPNGHLPPIAGLLVLGGVATVLAIAALIASRSIVSSLPRVVAGGPVLAFVAAVIAVASAAAVLANRDAVTWNAAHLSLVWIAAALLAGAGAAIATANVQRVEEPAPPRTSPSPAMVVSPTQRLAWVGTGRARYNVPFALGLSVIGAILLFVSGPGAGLVMLLVAALLGELSVVHLTIGATGVRVSAPFGLPVVRIPLDRIERAEAIDVHPLQWGGWGYRGSLWLFHRAAWVVRSGPGLRLDLRNGRVFVVTVDDAEEAAEVVNGLLASPTSTSP